MHGVDAGIADQQQNCPSGPLHTILLALAKVSRYCCHQIRGKRTKNITAAVSGRRSKNDARFERVDLFCTWLVLSRYLIIDKNRTGLLPKQSFFT
jgi:hypothetical protein